LEWDFSRKGFLWSRDPEKKKIQKGCATGETKRHTAGIGEKTTRKIKGSRTVSARRRSGISRNRKTEMNGLGKVKRRHDRVETTKVMRKKRGGKKKG